jgi:hypothetical protein
VRPTGDQFSVDNSEEGNAGLAARLTLIGPRLIVLEAAGGYQAPLVAMLSIEELPVAVVNPRQLSITSECLNKLVLLGERHLRGAVREFVEHYYLERNHQGLEHHLITLTLSPANDRAPIARRERLGGLLNYYYRRAAYTPVLPAARGSRR